ncbi:MAG: rRNA pseudouridine synthase [Clostridia bacterium]|nr:rRNA pseudouridine synthase [Clostridia bacterium]
MRLDKFLSNMGRGSRKDVHKLIGSGAVSIDGSVSRERDAQIDPETQTIAVNGEAIPYKPFVYIMVNKPAGYLSSTEDGSGPVVTDIFSGQYSSYKLGVAGRLDKDAEGLLLLTNDGPYIHRVITPEKHVKKSYFVKLAREISDADVVQFERGLRLADGTLLRPAGLEKADGVSRESSENAEGSGNAVSTEEHCALVTITEGRFHQVKKMFLSVGNEVRYLKRLKIGALELDAKLKPGEYRELTAEEAEKAYEQTDG